jgi:hypothetical protein
VNGSDDRFCRPGRAKRPGADQIRAPRVAPSSRSDSGTPAGRAGTAVPGDPAARSLRRTGIAGARALAGLGDQCHLGHLRRRFPGASGHRPGEAALPEAELADAPFPGRAVLAAVSRLAGADRDPLAESDTPPGRGQPGHAGPAALHPRPPDRLRRGAVAAGHADRGRRHLLLRPGRTGRVDCDLWRRAVVVGDDDYDHQHRHGRGQPRSARHRHPAAHLCRQRLRVRHRVHRQLPVGRSVEERATAAATDPTTELVRAEIAALRRENAALRDDVAAMRERIEQLGSRG